MQTQIPNRKERRRGIGKHKKNISSINLADFIANVKENIEVGREIHEEHVKENIIKNRKTLAETQASEYLRLMEIHKDEKVVNEILRKKYSKDNG